MTDQPRRRAPRVPAQEVSKRLIDAVIEMLGELPFQRITVRAIGARIGMDPQVIFRNFDSLEGLFVAVLHELDRRFTEFSKLPESSTMPMPSEFILRARLAMWLSLTGSDPALLTAQPQVYEPMKALVKRRLGLDPGVDRRAADAIIALALSAGQGAQLFAPFQPWMFTPQTTTDALVLIAKLVQAIPEIADDLGWNDPPTS